MPETIKTLEELFSVPTVADGTEVASDTAPHAASQPSAEARIAHLRQKRELSEEILALIAARGFRPEDFIE